MTVSRSTRAYNAGAEGVAVVMYLLTTGIGFMTIRAIVRPGETQAIGAGQGGVA